MVAGYCKELKMNHSDMEKFFRKQYLLTKPQLINALKRSRSVLSDSDDNFQQFTDSAITIYEKYYDSLIEKVQESTIPKLEELWWHYNFYTSINSISINICNASNIEMEDGCTSMTIEFEEPLFEVFADYISISDYADLHKVSVDKILKLISKGYIRSAKKDDKDNYIISELECMPSNESIMVDYSVVDSEKVIIPEFPTLKFAKEIHLYKFEEEKNVRCSIWADQDKPDFNFFR